MSNTDELDDIVKEFLIESYEGLDQLDRDLVILEHSYTDQQLLGRIFRSVHTVKGTCGFLGFTKLESVTHVGENLLAKLRDGELGAPGPELTTGLLRLVDAIRQMLDFIEKTGAEGDVDYSSVVAEMTRLLEPGAPQVETPSPVAHVVKKKRARKSGRPVGELLVDAGHADAADISAALQEQRGGRSDRLGTILVDRAAVDSAAVHDALETQQEGKSGGLSDSNIRVDVGLLDKLMTLVGELVLVRNQILQHASGTQQATLNTASQRLNLLTTELQEGVMKTRMQPIGNIWSKLPRVVRDLARMCDKQIRVEMEGSETELDKTIIEAIKDPLTHIVRNAADHGIETPAERSAAGKTAEGRLLLRAFHEGGQVNIEISDDGKGLNPERLRQKAVEKGLVTAEQAGKMSDRESLNLIFSAGFSTAAKVTNISGRGVGMDVVKTNIERIGGVVDVQSNLGEGTTLRIKIPLTLAIIPALVITTAANRYAIPQVNLVELVRREIRDGAPCVEMIHGAPVYRLRGNLLPLVFLRSAFDAAAPGGTLDESFNIVVLQADGRTFGLVVDEINDTEEIVVKPLSKHLQGIAIFSGATIMGDGRVALILDTLGLAKRANVISEKARERGLAEDHQAHADPVNDRQTLLICGTGDERRVAIPLSSVARLENFDRQNLEFSGNSEVVQYRDQILPLLDLSSLLGIGGNATKDTLSVVVYGTPGNCIGLVVDRILDIVDERVVLDPASTREGVLGSAVVQQRVTDILDISAIVQNAAPWLLQSSHLAESI